MLISATEQFVPAPFVNEDELEMVVVAHATLLFGSNIIYLPQRRIETAGGTGTIPDAIVIDLENNSWYVVEAELAAHGTWQHIAPQVSKQLAASATASSIDKFIGLALALAENNTGLKETLRDLSISELQLHSRLRQIFSKPPIVAIPIDAVPKDLKEWASTLRHEVKIWVLNKYVNTRDSSRIIYSLPDDNLPTLETVQEGGLGEAAIRVTSTQPYRRLMDAFPELVGQEVYLEYTPRGGEKKHFTGALRGDGVEVEGEVLSLSGAALRCLRRENPNRESANGWNFWRLSTGELLGHVYSRIPN